MAGPFELALKQWQDKTETQIDAWCRSVVLQLWGRLVFRSPVDTGRFRANWMYGYGAPLTTTVDVTGESGAPAPPPTPPVITVGIGVHYLTNSLPYAWPLEYGSSKQAPQGMVRLTAVEFQSIAARPVIVDLSTSSFAGLGVLGVSP